MPRTEPDYVAERLIPHALTCAACKHGPRCDALFGAVRKAFTHCDFWPSRFSATSPYIFPSSFAGAKEKPDVGVRPPAFQRSDPPPPPEAPPTARPTAEGAR